MDEPVGGHYRNQISAAERAFPFDMAIDPGFVNHRLLATYLGADKMAGMDKWIRELPVTPDYMWQARTNNIYTRELLRVSAAQEVPTLRQRAATNSGGMVCSIEEVGAFEDVYDAKRGSNEVFLPGFDDHAVTVEYSTGNIVADTMRARLRQGTTLAFIGRVTWDGFRGEVEPIVMGFPWLEAPFGTTSPVEYPEWMGFEAFEHFVEDVDEFAAVKGTSLPASVEPMRAISEAAFKACLGEILGDSVKKDWGGETSDHYSAHIHLAGHPTTAAFLLKGPAKFSEMRLNTLGKNNDQILRLSHEPAQILVVQHCHNIHADVRSTLRTFAVQPGNPRRYMLIDGRDSLQLLHAYNLYDRALELSQ